MKGMVSLQFIVYYSSLIFVLSFILFMVNSVGLLIVRIIVNSKIDKELKIKTTGTRSWKKNSLYNRTESTPYLALEHFAENYVFSKDDHLVDFGCGRGRVAIFLNKFCSVPVTGIEFNDMTYLELQKNVEKSSATSIQLTKERAEEYKIKDEDNKFFFFNPFHSSIFKIVVENILENARKNGKEVEIILYYPLRSFKKIVEKDFELTHTMKPRGSILFREKFLIYKFNPNENWWEEYYDWN